MGDSCYNHKRGLVVLAIVLGAIIAGYFYYNRPRNANVAFDFNGNWTIVKNDKRSPPTILKDSNDSIVLVSDSLTSWHDITVDYANKSCHLRPNLTYNSVSDRDAHILGNDQVLVVLKNSNVTRNQPLVSVMQNEWKIYLFDPKNCTHHELTLGGAGTKEHIANILPYHDTFDVIMENFKGAIPRVKVLRFDNMTNEVQNFSAALPNDFDSDIGLYIGKEHTPEEGYYYMRKSSDDEKGVMTVLNSTYGVVKRFKFSYGEDYDNDAFSMKHGRFSLCYFTTRDASRNNTQCFIVDLQSYKKLMNISMTYEHPIYDTTVTNLEQGGILVFYTRLHEDRSKTMFVRHVSRDATIGNPVEFGKIPANISSIRVFEMKDGSYCVGVSTNDVFMKKCFGPKKPCAKKSPK